MAAQSNTGRLEQTDVSDMEGGTDNDGYIRMVVISRTDLAILLPPWNKYHDRTDQLYNFNPKTMLHCPLILYNESISMASIVKSDAATDENRFDNYGLQDSQYKHVQNRARYNFSREPRRCKYNFRQVS
jgi:hypothetical protein